MKFKELLGVMLPDQQIKICDRVGIELYRQNAGQLSTPALWHADVIEGIYKSDVVSLIPVVGLPDGNLMFEARTSLRDRG